MSKTIELIFLGSGSAFTVGAHNYHSNILLQKNNSQLLIDCGSDIRFSLFEKGYSYENIDNVYISHLHADHAGGLEWLGFCRMFNSGKERPNLYISEQLISPLWENVLSGGMQSLKDTNSNLNDFFNVKSIGPPGVFVWNEIVFTLVKTIHVYNNHKINPSFGLFFTWNNKNIFITTDTAYSPTLFKEYYEKADIIFHDCETSQIKSGVHSHYEELKLLDPSIKQKMWLYHFNPGELPCAKKDGFKGFVSKGQTFVF